MKTNPAERLYVNVKSDTSVPAVAGILTQYLERSGYSPVEVRAIGPGAVNQAIKGVASAIVSIREAKGVELVVVPRIETGIDRRDPLKDVTRITLSVEVR